MYRAWPSTKGIVSWAAAAGQPVSGAHALDADHIVGAKGSNSLEEGLGPGGDVLVEDDGAGLVKDAQVPGPCVRVDTAVKSVLILKYLRPRRSAA